MFNRFLHIENHYSFKDGYVMLEKIDGSNIQFIFENGDLKNVASRNQIVNTDFNGYKSVIQQNEFIELFEKLKELSKDTTVNLYGEIYSNKIQRNIHYGENTNIKFFAMQINNKYISFCHFKSIINNDNLIVPIVGYYPTMEEALKFDVNNFKSIVANNGEIAEGVIIEPVNYWDEKRIIKFKSDKFKEIKPIKKSKEINLKAVELNNIFQSYLTENRLKNVISHYDISNINMKLKSKIILEFVNDAREDFIKDNDLNEFNKQELKDIFKFDFKNEMEKLNNLLR